MIDSQIDGQPCNICEHLLFKVDPQNSAVIKIKLPGTKEHVFNLNELNLAMRRKPLKLRNRKKRFFDVMQRDGYIIKIMCPACKKFSWFKLDKDVWVELDDDTQKIAWKN